MPAAFIWLIKGTSAGGRQLAIVFQAGSVVGANPWEGSTSTAPLRFPPNRGNNHCFTGSHLPGMDPLK